MARFYEIPGIVVLAGDLNMSMVSFFQVPGLSIFVFVHEILQA